MTLGRRLDPLDPQVGVDRGGSGRGGDIPPSGTVLIVTLGADDLHRPGRGHLLCEGGVLDDPGVQLVGDSVRDRISLGLPCPHRAGVDAKDAGEFVEGEAEQVATGGELGTGQAVRGDQLRGDRETG